MNYYEYLSKKYNISSHDFKTGIVGLLERHMSSTPITEPKAGTAGDFPDNSNMVQIQNLIDAVCKNLQSLKGALPDRFIKAILEDLDNIDMEDDDVGEIMGEIHGTIERNIYQSLQRVKPVYIPKLEEYLKNVGYQEIDVHVGDDITKFVEYFAKYFPEPTFSVSQRNKIKQIDIKPYQKKYTSTNGDEVLLKLRGHCVYYAEKGKK